jgi:hypothetical protein
MHNKALIVETTLLNITPMMFSCINSRCLHQAPTQSSSLLVSTLNNPYVDQEHQAEKCLPPGSNATP